MSLSTSDSSAHHLIGSDDLSTPPARSLGNKQTQQPTPSTKEVKRRSLFVRSLPASATTQTLTEFFSQSYPLKHATVVSDPTSKLSKGYGFVTFTNSGDASAALEAFNGALFDGQRIKVELAEPRSRDTKSSGSHTASTPARTRACQGRQQTSDEPPPQLIIRNLPWTISEPEQLAVLFRSYGKVKRTTMPKRKPGLSPGFGFVVLRGRRNTEKALKGLNGKVVDGRTLAVDWAVGKDVWDSMNQSKATNAAHAEPMPSGESHSDTTGDENEDHGITDQAAEEISDAATEFLRGGVEGPIEDPSGPTVTGRTEHDSSATLFVRNVPFTITDEDLSRHFASFGPVRYSRIVMDPSTERSKGTAFVAFWNEVDAIACLRAAPKAASTPTYGHKTQLPPSNVTSKRSILEDTNRDSSGRYTIDGRLLQISRAVDKGEATRLTAAGHHSRDVRDRDRRRLYLLGEGTIPSQTPLYSQLVPSEVALREDSAKQRQNLVKNNPALHLSLTRLSVRNLPRSITSKDLKALAREAVVGFSRDVKAGLRQPLSKEELSRAGDLMREAERARKARGKGIVKQAKVIFEGRKGEKVTEDSGAGRSKGYAFIEYTSHRWALMGLRWLNGHAVGTYSGIETNVPNSKERKKRLVVEFAIENAQVVGRRQERETQSHDKQRSAESGTSNVNGQQTSRVKAPPKAAPREGLKRKRALDARSNHLVKGADGIDLQDEEATERLAKKQKIIGRKRMARKARRSI
ncbi:MAG: hypothetical protein L6R40_002465 [Gallowayella cf. fulva]|nr:MAG: hypothetical protein L6R40_002465 [Xanthomendoza cf. fulva]